MFTTGFGRTDTTTERWHRFVQENVKDWNGTNLVATVLISAAVAFLAVPGIDNVSRCMALISVLVAVASIVTGLLNVWQHQHETRATPELITIVRHLYFSSVETFIYLAFYVTDGFFPASGVGCTQFQPSCDPSISPLGAPYMVDRDLRSQHCNLFLEGPRCNCPRQR